jgi:glycosyltransferase involved in cell wall biosynthesis
MSEAVYHNALPRPEACSLTIATPFFRNDPTVLITALAREAKGLPVHLVVVDDGSGVEALTTATMDAIAAFPAPAELVTFERNQGRSAARNRLIAGAVAPYILFLDSDMLPDQADFLQAWLRLIDRTMPVISYGGYSTLQAPDIPKHALARALAEAGDCRPANERSERGPLAVATSNLLVRRDVMEAVPFDAGFSGWGWEDVDWALRASEQGYAVAHVDIPATHLGLDEAVALLEKYAKAGPNFRRMIERHPRMLSLAGTRAARVLAKVPLQTHLRSVLRVLACSDSAPLALRTRAARLWRASWAAESLSIRRST